MCGCISLSTLEKGDKLGPMTVRQVFKDQISPGLSLDFGMSASYYPLTYGK